MMRYLTIHVRMHEGRYHGDGEAQPSPFRLFQALVAGAGLGGPLDDRKKHALTWLERLPDAPIVGCPREVSGQAVTMFMPNNDLDKFGGDVRNIAKTRGAQKVWKPRHFDEMVSWVFAWPFAEDGAAHAATICALAEDLYQFGRGVDMAWAWGEILDEQTLGSLLSTYNGIVRRPGAGVSRLLACPSDGSLESLVSRYQARRFRNEGGERVFVQQPKPTSRQIAYESPPSHHLFELRASTDSDLRIAWHLERTSKLVLAARDAARARLATAMPNRIPEIDKYLIGRRADGSNAAPMDSRVRIIAIPSIGMHYADRAIRRLLVEVPAACPLRSEDVRWAFSGAELADPDSGKLMDLLLSPSSEDDMLGHYGVGSMTRIFRSVTPVVLPEEGRRRRIDPARRHAEAKSGLERVTETSAARAAVIQALRHAGVRTPTESIRLQREPFESAGSRVEVFAAGTRFEKERLWHVEVAFSAPVEGPLLLGDGRFLGLGLMAPVKDTVPGVHAFAVTNGLVGQPDTLHVVRALRRAVMARVQAAVGADHRLAAFFSGHAEDGSPIQRSRSSHLSFVFEPASRRLLVIAPHVAERRSPTLQELDHLRCLDVALEGFSELRAGQAGVLSLSSTHTGEDGDALIQPSAVWRSVTPYVVTRHSKAGNAAHAVELDIRTECRRVGLPQPRVEIGSIRGIAGFGLTGLVRLTFDQQVEGPILLGRNRHLGGGLFQSCVD